MIRSAMQALAGLAFFVLAACASLPQGAQPVIADPGEIYSTWSWNKDIEAGIIDGGHKDQIETIKAHSTEKAWPEKLANLKTRAANPDIIRQYRGQVIATFKNGDTPVAVVQVPAKENTHMPEGWKPAEDIYIVIKQAALAKQ